MNLAKYDAACRAVAEAKTVDEAKDLRDKAEAMRAYARQAKNRQLEVDTAEIRMRAERRLGEIIKLQKDTVGLATGGDAMKARFQRGTEVRPTLAEVGIDKKLSMRAQKLAAVPEGKFEGMLGEWRERVSEETTALDHDDDNYSSIVEVKKTGRERRYKDVARRLWDILLLLMIFVASSQ